MGAEKVVERAKSLLDELGKLDEEIHAYKISGKYQEKKNQVNVSVRKIVGEERAFSESRKEILSGLIEKKKKLELRLKSAARKGDREVLAKLKDELSELEIDFLIAQNQSQFKPDEIELFAKADERKEILATLKEEEFEQEKVRDAVLNFHSISSDIGRLATRIDSRNTPPKRDGQDKFNLEPLGLEKLMSTKTKEFYNRSNSADGLRRERIGTHDIIFSWLKSNVDMNLEEFAIRQMKHDAEREKQKLIEQTQERTAKGYPDNRKSALKEIESYLE